MASEDLDGLESEELKKLKTKEEILRLRLRRGIESCVLCDQREVLEKMRPVVVQIIEKWVTLADDLANDLANSDSAIVHSLLTDYATRSMKDIKALLDHHAKA